MSKQLKKWSIILSLTLLIAVVAIAFLSIRNTKADQAPAVNQDDLAFLQRNASNMLHPQKTGASVLQPKSTLSPNATPNAAVSQSWYFAEGRIGKGFREYLTIENPSTNACAVTIQYNYTPDGRAPANKAVAVSVKPTSRLTASVNQDLGYLSTANDAAIVAAIIKVNTSATPNCAGVVAERPIYFSNFRSISSGTNVLGATKLFTSYAFADVPTGTDISSYLTILNPNATAAKVVVGYYSGGKIVTTQSTTVPANARGTIAPNGAGLPTHVAAIVASDQVIMVERPTYFKGVGAGQGTVSGAFDIAGSPYIASAWLFAEGYTGSSTQEYITLANYSDKNVSSTVNIILESKTGASKSFPVTIKPQSQVIWNVNANNTFAGSSPEVSVAVGVTQGDQIVAQREMFFNYRHTLPNGRLTTAQGGTDVIGQIIQQNVSYSSYTFAEGYANTGYNAWLTIQNPTNKAESITITLLNGLGKTNTHTVSIPANSRYTEDLAALVQNVFHSGTDNNANAFSITVQALDGSPFVAERPIYFNTYGVSSFAVQGGNDIIGYIGG